MTFPFQDGLCPCAPAQPPAAYQGGKRYLARRIIERIAAIPHDAYVEPFVGMGGVFLRRPFRARSEVVNDASGDVANLFRVLQRHYQALMDMLRWQLTSRAEFDRLRRAEPETLTDLERAARFLYLQRVAYGGKVTGRNFAMTPGLPGRFDVGKLAPMLAEVHERLAAVVVEQMPFGKLIGRYDRPGALVYCDPPYHGSEDAYGAEAFAAADHGRLAEQLHGLAGTFLLSINDHPEIRTLYAGCRIEEVATVYHVSGRSQRVVELLISP